MALREIAMMRGDWAGIPMPLADLPLIIEPSYPNAEKIADINRPIADPADDDGWRLINQWYSDKHRCDILLMRGPDGQIGWGKVPAVHGLTQQINTLGASEAWGLDQEQAAMLLLGGLISHDQMRQYVLTGSFLEKSDQSGVIYMFRRLRPTVAMAPDRGNPAANMRILCGLCMHPIAYYSNSWAGAMTPTDDVVAHLMLMRGDEHMFWKRCNQHPPYRPEAGL